MKNVLPSYLLDVTHFVQLLRMKADFAKRADKAKERDLKYRDSPDIVVKVVCRYRAELFFKISRKTKLSRLINSWTERMERSGGKLADGKGGQPTLNGSARGEVNSTQGPGTTTPTSMQFIFTFNGRTLDAEQTPEEIGIDEGDEILAVELMDLTDAGGGGSEEWVGRNNTVRRHAPITVTGGTYRTLSREIEEELDP